jgi:hypothetical protein
MQTVGRVNVEILQATHLPDVRWDPDEVTSIKPQMRNRFELRDGSREFDYVHQILGFQL